MAIATAAGGNATLIGGRGTDTLTGGAGADLFQFVAMDDSRAGVGRDLITDFVQGSDLIDLSALDASRYIGTGFFTGRSGEMRYAAFEGGTVIELDTNGDRVADFQIGLDDFVALSFADFRGLETDASGRGGGSTKTNAMTSRFSFEDGSSTSDQHYAPVMLSNDTWLASNDSLLIYA